MKPGAGGGEEEDAWVEEDSTEVEGGMEMEDSEDGSTELDSSEGWVPREVGTVDDEDSLGEEFESGGVELVAVEAAELETFMFRGFYEALCGKLCNEEESDVTPLKVEIAKQL